MSMSTTPHRVAVVTGGAKGIGAEVCRGFAARGHKVWIADLDLAHAQSLADALRQQGGQAQAIGLDVGNPESVAQAFAEIDAQDHLSLIHI